MKKCVSPHNNAECNYGLLTVMRMKMAAYVKAEEILPQELLDEIQKYVQGALVYIPRPRKSRLGWGYKNGTRAFLDNRNTAIRQAKSAGRTIEDLANEYNLSPDGIKKILYAS